MKARAKARHRQNAKPAQGAGHSSRIWLLAGVFILAGTAAWAFAEFVVWNRLPAELVGKWVVEGGEQDGATFDFYRSGSMVGHINVRGREGVIEASVAVEEDRLLSTTLNPSTGGTETRSQTIVLLTKTQLILRDGHGSDLRMVRAN